MNNPPERYNGEAGGNGPGIKLGQTRNCIKELLRIEEPVLAVEVPKKIGGLDYFSCLNCLKNKGANRSTKQKNAIHGRQFCLKYRTMKVVLLTLF
ncbi:MAG: hypothetical protein AAF939_22190 [Planctomycetota bacterium]